MYFIQKKDAISYLNKTNDKSVMLFQIDKDINGSKKFLVDNYQNVFNMIKKGNNNIYESWLENTGMYFGIDLDINDNKQNYLEIVNDTINAVINTAYKIYEYTYKLKDFYITKTDDNNKISIHITCRGLVFENYKVCKQFYNKIKENYIFEYVDDSIYRMTCLRTCYSTKLGKNLILKPIQMKVNNKNTKSIPKNNFDIDFWKKSLIINIDQKDRIIKYKKEKLNIKKENENENLNNNRNLTDLELLINKLPQEYCDNFDKWVKIGLILYNNNNNNYNIFNNWSKKSNRYNEEKNKKIWDKFQNSNSFNGKKLTVGSILYWLKENNINIKEIFNNSIDRIVNQYPNKKIKLENNFFKKEINSKRLNTEDLKDGYSKKLLCIQSEKGTGKTTSLIKNIFNSGNPEFETILFISSRRTFGLKLFNDLAKYGFKLYSNIDEHFITEKRIIIQVDSLMRLNIHNYDLIIIDECETLARYMGGSHFLKNINSSIITRDLEYRIENSKKTVIMDADLSDRCINYYSNISNIRKNDVYILLNHSTPYEEYTINYMNYDNWIKNILNLVTQNKKLVIPMASNNKAKDLNILLNKYFTDKKILLIHKETSDEDKLKKLINVNNDWVNYDVVIYTPTVCMGVSFDIPKHFDHICGYGCHHSLGAQEFCQMLHRVREPKKKQIFLAVDMYKYFDETEDLIDYNLVEEMISSDFYLTKYKLNNNMIPIKFGKDRIIEYPYKNEPIYDLYVRNSKERIENLNNFSASLFGYIKFKKYKLKYIESIDSDKVYKDDLKNIAKIRKNEDFKLSSSEIIKAKLLTEKEYKEKIKRKDEYMDEETLYEIQKYNLFDCYNLDKNKYKITEEFLENYNNKNKMMNYKNFTSILNSNEQTIDKILIFKDNEQIEQLNIYEEFKNKNKFTYHYYPIIILKYLNIDINDYDKIEINEIEIEKSSKVKINNLSLIEFLQLEKNNINYKYNFNNCKINFTIIKDLVKYINKILSKQYGLKLHKNKEKYIFTTNKLWDDLPTDIKAKELKRRFELNKTDVTNDLDFIE
tara:strand:+ start:2704 stop:5829 length:3126 start_codon:yes stop_codon:yes gene_type:complete